MGFIAFLWHLLGFFPVPGFCLCPLVSLVFPLSSVSLVSPCVPCIPSCPFCPPLSLVSPVSFCVHLCPLCLLVSPCVPLCRLCPPVSLESPCVPCVSCVPCVPWNIWRRSRCFSYCLKTLMGFISFILHVAVFFTRPEGQRMWFFMKRKIQNTKFCLTCLENNLCLLARLSFIPLENLWLNSGVISRAMFARALKELRNNNVSLGKIFAS